MKSRTIIKFFIATCLMLGGNAYAAVVSSLSFTNPTGTATSTDTIEIWVTLSLDPSSEALTYDSSISPLAGLPASLIPTEGYDYVTSSYVPFASYTDARPLTGRYCNDNFTNGCSAGEYTFNYTTSWFDIRNNSFTLNPGESRDFLFDTFIPTDGSATPGNYIFYNGYLGFNIIGLDAAGNTIDATINLGITCPTRTADCAFTRTVSAVPVPAAVWLFGSGLIGLAGIARRKIAAA